VKRLAEFIRSVIPADPFQLLFLAGVVCLIAAHGLRWQPVGLPSAGQSAGDFGLWLQYGALIFVYFIIFSGMAGYFVCFWAGKHPLRRVIRWVCAPALLGLGLMFFRILYLTLARRGRPFLKVPAASSGTGFAGLKQICGNCQKDFNSCCSDWF